MKLKPFYMLDIETFANSADCRGKSFIAMPNFAFVYVSEEGIKTLYGRLPVQEQVNMGAAIGASTLAFWMKEARDGNPASREIIKALDSSKGMVHYSATGRDSDIWESYILKDISSLEVLLEVRAFFDTNGKAPVLGNGPEFDNVIFEAQFRKLMHELNQRHDIEMPWKFWESSSARTYKEIAMDKGHYVKNIQADATKAAIDHMEMLASRTDGGLGGPVPHKHDPLLDALSEAFTVELIKRLI